MISGRVCVMEGSGKLEVVVLVVVDEEGRKKIVGKCVEKCRQ